MGYKNGRFAFRYVNCLGYRQGADDEPEIVPEEAEIIRMIYQNYLDGDSLGKIKSTLEEKGILTATGKKEWGTAVIIRVLQNEKYKGDALLQKSYTVDFLTKKRK